MKRLLAVTLLILLAMPAAAHELKVGDLSIVHPWARATAGAAKNGAVYMKIENQGSADDRLIAAAAEVADMVQFHEHVMENDVAHMRHVHGVDIPARGTAELKPGGYHIMLMGLKQKLMEYDTFQLTLTFERAGSIDVEVQVEAAGATEPAY